MASSGSPLDTEAQSARETIVSAYASTVAASAEGTVRLTFRASQCRDDSASVPLPEASFSA